MLKSINRAIYGPTPEEKVKAWQLKLKTESRVLDREINQLTREQAKARAEVKKLAMKGEVKQARMLAKEVIRSDKQKEKLHVGKARLGSIGTQLAHQLAMVKVTGAMQKSTQIMKLSNDLIKLPQISAGMQEMQFEMTKAGVIEDMIGDTLEMADDDEELEEEADAEVEAVLWNITEGKLGKAGAVGQDLPATEIAENEEETDAEMARMQEQLAGLLNG
ncbi:Vacuolar protein-sorting-associated protein 24 [Tulasnella sp. JGI-2019a]|nr:Vacuolar protein-sorting-associated protein 24 [Tulasnella sp. JGI-2019a]KAG9015737.1 Vacuolar protein-sorting-associated protein 24 [Tulasnella sp. JGI-2019a]KAG9039632.1 Vacuolar protein-sorting-associated protein 24 [Tulasnella sp. JGI-2019a]